MNYARCLAVLLLALSAAASAAAEPLTRYVHFRDGSVLKVQLADQTLPWRRITEDGQIESAPLRLSEVWRLDLVRQSKAKKLADVKRLLRELGDDIYVTREKAQAELIKKGGEFQSLLKRTLAASKDPEILWRLGHVIKSLPKEVPAAQQKYDRASLSQDKQGAAGDLAEWTATADFRGHKIKLSRATVASITRDPGATDFFAKAKIERILADKDEHLPPRVTRLEFTVAPDGRPLKPGEDLATTFAPLGCLLSTSVPGAAVVIQDFPVDGRSGPPCAGTEHPQDPNLRYSGVITIRFCAPGRPNVRAGVRFFGVWVAHVYADGTVLEAYDAAGRRLAALPTIDKEEEHKDFLALRSNVPIANVRIVPNLEIDDNYAIDDVAYDPPEPLGRAGDHDAYVARLADGQRIRFGEFELTDERIVLRKLAVGPATLAVPRGELAALFPPQQPASSPGDKGFALTSDGSILEIRPGGMRPTFARLPKLEVKAADLAAVWGGGAVLADPAIENWPAGSALLLRFGKKPLTVTPWRLGPKWIESPKLELGFFEGGWLDEEELKLLTAAERRAVKPVTFANGPLVWLAKPSPRSPRSGLLRLADGEEFVLDSAAAFQLKSWDSKHVALAKGDVILTVPLADVAALVLPRAE